MDFSPTVFLSCVSWFLRLHESGWVEIRLLHLRNAGAMAPKLPNRHAFDTDSLHSCRILRAPNQMNSS